MIALSFAITVLALLAYCVWITTIYSKAKSDAAERKIEADGLQNMLTREQKNRAIEKESYEARLHILQEKLDSLKAYILNKLGKPDAVDFILGMHEPEIPNDGKPD